MRPRWASSHILQTEDPGAGFTKGLNLSLKSEILVSNLRFFLDFSQI